MVTTVVAVLPRAHPLEGLDRVTVKVSSPSFFLSLVIEMVIVAVACPFLNLTVLDVPR